MKEIRAEELWLKAVDQWKNQWLLLTAGTMEDCNMMTVAWGSIGCMWNRPFAQIVVRPQRYTMQYLERSDSFTLCAFPEEYHRDLQHLGTVSGRDGDKLADTALTLMESSSVLSPGYNQASLILECRKMYAQNMDPACFITDTATRVYPEKDFHRIYFGEIVKMFGA
ncbi:MAG: flavin reductase family protein [Candidatus Fermentibacteria bacterium]|nr:flavin reductase family protein [Candidatus Fermentibacteria bacterium]